MHTKQGGSELVNGGQTADSVSYQASIGDERGCPSSQKPVNLAAPVQVKICQMIWLRKLHGLV